MNQPSNNYLIMIMLMKNFLWRVPFFSEVFNLIVLDSTGSSRQSLLHDCLHCLQRWGGRKLRIGRSYFAPPSVSCAGRTRTLGLRWEHDSKCHSTQLTWSYFCNCNFVSRIVMPVLSRTVGGGNMICRYIFNPQSSFVLVDRVGEDKQTSCSGSS